MTSASAGEEEKMPTANGCRVAVVTLKGEESVTAIPRRIPEWSKKGRSTWSARGRDARPNDVAAREGSGSKIAREVN